MKHQSLKRIEIFIFCRNKKFMKLHFLKENKSDRSFILNNVKECVTLKFKPKQYDYCQVPTLKGKRKKMVSQGRLD